MTLIERHFKVSRAGSAKITRAPFNVKGPVGRCASDYGKDAIAGLISAQVVLIREDGHGPTRVWQGETAMGERTLSAYEIETAIGPDVRSGKGLPVNGDREWQRNAGGAIIAMVACVSRPRHNRIGARAR